MPLTAWSDVVLCTEADVLQWEANWLDWTKNPQAWRAKAKDVLAQRLRVHLREQELATDAAEVLDLLGNPEVLKDPACMQTLALAAESNKLAPGDYWTEKAALYRGLFERELEQALAMLSVDIDESGDIDDTEKYTAVERVRLTRGGAV